jgi:uncharacterized protein (DUF305 family)
MRTSVVGTVLAAVAVTALIAGCGSNQGSMPEMLSDGPSPTSTGPMSDHNQADATFAEQMIPHHQAALALTAMVPTHTANPRVRDLATQIGNGQKPEIDEMTGWLARWGISMPTPRSPAPPNMSAAPQLPGVPTTGQTQQLRGVSGAGFDHMWLNMMIKHHQGAVEVAKTELAQGGNAEAKALAQRIVDTQQTQIDQMRGLLR